MRSERGGGDSLQYECLSTPLASKPVETENNYEKIGSHLGESCKFEGAGGNAPYTL